MSVGLSVSWSVGLSLFSLKGGKLHIHAPWSTCFLSLFGCYSWTLFAEGEREVTLGWIRLGNQARGPRDAARLARGPIAAAKQVRGRALRLPRLGGRAPRLGRQFLSL